MIGVEGKDEPDFTALDQELFGDVSSNGGEDDDHDGHGHDHNNCHKQTLQSHNSSSTKNPDHSPSPHFDASTPGTSEPGEQAPQIAATSRSGSGHYTPPLSLPMTPVSPPTEHMPDSTQMMAENISWVKNRITDVHQLLLHYLSVRTAHRSMATNLQKEMMLQGETKEALERIREQQDQTSEDVPRLQFQIAQLKLDCQNERAARAAVEASLVNSNEKLLGCGSEYSLLQAQVLEYEAGEKRWQKEKEELTILLESLANRTGNTRHRDLPSEESSSLHALAEARGHWSTE